MLNKLIILFIGILVVLNFSEAQTIDDEMKSDRIILNLTTDPSRSISVTWRTSVPLTNPLVQYAIATPWTEFTDSLSEAIPSVESVKLDNDSTVTYYSVILKNLKPNITYAYRVGSLQNWSEWNQFKTAIDGDSSFQFVFFGDPQNDIKEHVSRIFREAFMKVPEAKFWLFSGDITSEPEDAQFEQFYFAAGFIFRMIPSVMVPGNHDNEFKMENGKIVLNQKGKKERTKIPPPTWRAQFNLPENGIPGFEESSYYFDYQGARFIMLNSNDRLIEQAVWMEKLLADNPNNWTIVSFHHPLYSAGRERDDRETRDAFLPLFDKYNVDLVLTGHDHAYSRSYKLKKGQIVSDDQPGTVYVVSVSGPKMYEVNTQYSELTAKIGGNVQLFQSISISKKQLKYESYTSTGDLFDSFELKK